MDAMNPRRPRPTGLVGSALGLALLLAAPPARAQAAPAAPAAPTQASPEPRRTIQNRFAVKEGTFGAHLTATSLVRNDLYNTVGLGLDFSYYPLEVLGAEVRLALLHASPSGAARDIQQKTGLTPDARAHDALLLAGARYSVGYGKVMLGQRHLVHFDPQIALHTGVALAEGRLLPTLVASPGLLAHFPDRWQVRLDLGLAGQLERRDRGWVPTLGFAPMISVGRALGEPRKAQAAAEHP